MADTTVARIKLALEGASTVEKGLAQVEQKVAGVGKALIGLAGGLSVAGFASWVRGAINAADEAAKLAQKTGLAVNEVAGLQLAFRQSGAEATQFVPILAKLSAAAVNGSDALKAMGVQTRNTDGSLKGTRQLLGDVAEKFAGYQDGAAKTALAVKLFGEEGAKILPLLNQGAEGLAAYDETARKLGLTVETETGKAAERFNDTLDRLSARVDGSANLMATQLIPVLEAVSSEIERASKSAGAFSGVGTVMSVALEAIVVAGANVAFVFRGIWREFSTLGAQAVAVAERDFAKVRQIHKDAVADAIRDRQELDRFQRQILSARGIAELIAGASDLDEPRFARMIKAGAAASKTAAPEVAKLGAATKKVADAEKELAEQRRNSMAVVALRNKMAEEAYKQMQRELAAIAANSAAYTAELDRQVLAAYEAAAAAEEQVALYGLSQVQIAELTLTRLEDARAQALMTALTLDDVRALDAQIAAQKRVVEATRTVETRNIARESAAEAAREWQNAATKIEDMLTDALMRGFENGKGFGENLADSIVNMFKTFVAREIARAISQAIMAALASTNWGSALGGIFGLGGGGGAMGNLSTLSSVGGAIYQFGTGASVGTSSAGLGYANMVGAFGGDSLGALYTANGGWAGVSAGGGAAGGAGGGAAAGSGWMAAAGYAALIVAAIAIANNLYDKGYTRAALGLGGAQQQNFMNSSFQTDPRLGNSNIYNTSMERLNLSVLKGIGLSDKWADILSGTTRMATLFGRKLAAYGFDVGISGADVNVGGYQFYKGGLFRSDKTRAMDVDPSDAEMIRQQVSSVRESASAMAGALGLSREAIDSYTASLKINFKNAHTAEQQAQRLSEAMENLHFEMLRAASGGTLTKESFKQTMEQAQASMEQVGVTAQSIGEIIMQGMLGRMNQAQVGQALAEQVLGGIYQTIASPFATQIASAFQAQIITPVFTAILAGVPISQAISQQAIANVVATAQQAAATLNAIFSDAGFRQAIGDIQNAIGGIAAASVQPAAQVRGLTSSFSAAGNAANAARQAWRSLTDSIIEEVRRLRGVIVGDTSAGLAYTQALFATTTAQARAGDREAFARLPEISQALEELLRENSETLSDFQAGLAANMVSLMETNSIVARRNRFRLPSYDVGTNYVPRNTLAMLHEGEAIVPKAYNPAAGGVDNGQVLQVMTAVLVEMQAMRLSMSDMAVGMRGTHEILDRVSQGGEALLIEEAA